MKVSIIIPVYNVAPYIIRCLQSVANQTFSDIDCYLIDDCGNDNSIELAQSFINNYFGKISFTILHHSKNRGLSAARNTGIIQAKGEFIYFLDSDDTITPDCIGELVSLTEKYPYVDFVQGNVLNEDNRISKIGWQNLLSDYYDKTNLLERIILLDSTTSAWNKLIRRSFLIENNLFFPEGIIHEDMYWCFFIAKYSTSAAYTNKGTYTYYINANSILTSVSVQTRIHRYFSRLYASNAFITTLDKDQSASKSQRLYIARNLISAMIEVAALHSFHHWHIFWKHIWKLYTKHKRLTFWQHILFVFLMPPLCFPIRVKGWHWRVEQYIVNKV